MGLEKDEDAKRLPVALAITAARKRQRKQTGLIHYCYESHYVQEQDTLPLLENACFSLALFRTRLSENIAEARALLEKILAFECEGNFPVYLHEYPECRDKTLSLHLLPVFYWIERDFGGLLGEELRERLSGVMQRVAQYGKSSQLSRTAAWKLHAFLFPQVPLEVAVQSAVEWGEWLIALQMMLPAVIEQQISLALESWHPTLLADTGSPRAPFQEGEQPAVTLYDLFMGYFLQSYSQRALRDHPVHLRAALIQPFSLDRNAGQKEPLLLQVHPEEEIALRLLWGDAEHLHSLVCPRKKSQIVVEKISEDAVDLIFHLPEQLPEDGEGRVELALFCDHHPETTVCVNQGRANTFQLGEPLEILTPKGKVALTFSLQEGEGVFFGHLSFANRPSQLLCKGENQFEAYDWQISVRTARREPNCSLRLNLSVRR